MTGIDPKVGDIVKAFHPLTLGVVKVGEVVGVGPKYIRIKFRPGGGALKVARRHVVDYAE
jgi:hypothetical protein